MHKSVELWHNNYLQEVREGNEKSHFKQRRFYFLIVSSRQRPHKSSTLERVAGYANSQYINEVNPLPVIIKTKSLPIAMKEVILLNM